MMMRFGRKSLRWGRGLMIGSGIVAAITAILLGAAISPSPGSSYSEVIEFELEYPSATLTGIEVPSSNAMWGAASADADDRPISQFFMKTCGGDVCVLNGSIAAVGPTGNLRIAVSISRQSYRYSLDIPAAVTGPVNWTPWRSGDEARIRWRIVKR